MDDLARRVRRLERINAGLAGVIVLGGLMAAVQIPKVVQAERFELVGPSGKPTAIMSVVNGDPKLMFTGRTGKVQASLGLMDGESHLTLSDDGRKAMISMIAGRSRIETSPDGGMRINFDRPGAGPGYASLSMQDGEGKERIKIIADAKAANPIEKPAGR
jgi:hypothetical protein